jgi:hypothetical protein
MSGETAQRRGRRVEESSQRRTAYVLCVEVIPDPEKQSGYRGAENAQRNRDESTILFLWLFSVPLYLPVVVFRIWYKTRWAAFGGGPPIAF